VDGQQGRLGLELHHEQAGDHDVDAALADSDALVFDRYDDLPFVRNTTQRKFVAERVVVDCLDERRPELPMHLEG
jgi:hypothetical protein